MEIDASIMLNKFFAISIGQIIFGPQFSSN